MSLTILKEPSLFCLSRNPIVVAVNTSLGNAAGVKVKIEVFMDDNDVAFAGGFNSTLYTEEQTPDANGNVIFELQNNLDAALRWFKPDFFATNGKCADGVRQYTYGILEYNNGVNTDSYEQAPDPSYQPKVVYKGGVSKEQFKSDNYFFDQFIHKGHVPVNSTHQLTWWTYQQKYLTTGIYTPQYLMFHAPIGAYSAQVNFKSVSYFDDGSTVTSNYRVSALESGTNVGQLFWFACGVEQLGLENGSSTAKLVKYSIQLMHNSSPLTDAMWYTVDYKYSRTDRALLYNNSIGGVDTVRLFYQEQMAVQINEQRGEFNTSLVAKRFKESETFSYGIFEQQKRIANTGALRKADVDGLRQLALAEMIYEYLRSTSTPPVGMSMGVRYLPVQRDSLKIAFHKNNPRQNPSVFTMEYSIAILNNSYTPEIMGSQFIIGPFGVSYQYTFAIPNKTSGQKYGFAAVSGTSFLFLPAPSLGVGLFNSIATLLLYVQQNWSGYGYWSINADGKLQLDSDTDYTGVGGCNWISLAAY